MKHKITRRLIASFSVVLLLFALVSAMFFSLLFARHTADVTIRDLRAHAVSIADTLSQFVQDYEGESCRGGGFKAYLRFMSKNVSSDLYLVDQQGTPVSLLDISPSASGIPDHLMPAVQSIFQSGEVVSTSPVSIFRSESLIAGAPVLDHEGAVRYALLLHSSVNHVMHTRMDGLQLLALSLCIAMVLTSMLSICLSHHLVKPLRRMMEATSQIASGHYGKHTGVSQNDEIGVLASHIDALSAQLEIAEQERRQLDQMRQDFFSDISHELRTPISVLRGSVEMLRNGMVTQPDELEKTYDQLHSDVLHLQRLINDLLDLARMQNTQFCMDMACVNLVDVLEDTLRSMRPAADRKKISVLFENLSGPVPVMGDYSRLRQLITILLDNAVKFSPENASVILRSEADKEHCIVSVIDHGVGMDKDTLDHIFDRYFHSRSALNRSGTGLGLPIAMEIARRHQISIACQSIPDRQTCFTLTIPLCAMPESDA